MMGPDRAAGMRQSSDDQSFRAAPHQLGGPWPGPWWRKELRAITSDGHSFLTWKVLVLDSVFLPAASDVHMGNVAAISSCDPITSVKVPPAPHVVLTCWLKDEAPFSCP